MDGLYTICKGFTDPVFIIFILISISLILCFISGKKKNGILILCLAALLLYGASIEPVANYLSYTLEKDYFHSPVIKKPIDIIIVLAGGKNDVSTINRSFVSEASAARLLHGVEVFKKYGAQYFVCAGKADGKIPESEIMANIAVSLGVPKEKIKIDIKSNNTWEHAIELKKMFVNKNISVGIVTSGYHMKRSEREFKKYFTTVVPLPASYLYSLPTGKSILKYIPQTTAMNKTATALREFVGLLWYKIREV